MILLILNFLFPERVLAPQALMGSHISIRETPFALFYQPALLPGDFSFSTSYSKPYEGLDISAFESVFSFPLFRFSGSVGVSYFGEEIYKEEILSLGFSKKEEFFSIGFSLKYLYLDIPDVARHGEPTFDFGTVFYLPFNIEIGGYLRNIYRSKEFKNDIPSLFAFSFAVLHETLKFYFDLVSEENHPIYYTTGFEIPVIENFYIKGGIKNNERMFGLGFGINYSLINLEGIFRIHQILGSSFSISITLRKNKIEKNKGI